MDNSLNNNSSNTEHISIRKKVLDLVRNKRTHLPTLPVVSQNIIGLINSDRSSAKDLVESINKDQAIAAKVLKLANSAYYGMRKRVDTILRAITIVGFNEIINLTLAISIFPNLTKYKKAGLNLEEFWRHSIGSSFAAKLLRDSALQGSIKGFQKSGLDESSSNIFLPALFHDLGKMLFAIEFSEQYKKVLKDADNSQESMHIIEKRSLGMDHAEIADLLMEHWNLPDTIALPVRYHHNPAECPDGLRNAAEIIQIADYVTHNAEIGASGNKVLQADKYYLGGVHLTSEQLDKFSERLKEKRPEIEDFLTLMR